MTGLTAGRELARQGHTVDIYEASDRIGGLAKTYRDDDGFVYDNGPRFIFSTLAEKIGIAHLCEPVQYYEDMYVGGRYYQFPFGFIRNARYCASVGVATLTRSLHRRPLSLGEFLRTYYGRIFSREVLIPLIEKWAGIPAQEISVDFASRLLPSDLSYIIYSIIKKLRGGVTEDYYRKGRYIVYPKGSNAVIFETLAATPGMNVHLNSPLERLNTSEDRIHSAQIAGRTIKADYFLSTIPIHHASRALDRPGPAASWQQFQYRGIMILFVKLVRPRLLSHLWTWFPESKFRFYRIAEFKNARADLAPPDKTLISIEIGCNSDESTWDTEAAKLFDEIYPDLQRLYGLDRRDVLSFDLKKSPYAYPVMRAATESAQRALTHQTPFKNLFLAGRTGIFQYRMLEGCYESAMTSVEAMNRAMAGDDVAQTYRPATDRYGRPLVVPE